MNPITQRTQDRARLEPGRRISSPRRYWTNREIDLLKKLYPDRPAAEIAEQLNRQLTSVYSKAKDLGLSKSEEFLKGPLSGRLDGLKGAATRFHKGHTGVKS